MDATGLHDAVPTVHSSLATVAATFRPEMIASFDIPAFAITVDDTNIYWSMGALMAPFTTPDWPTVMQCPKSDCTKRTALAWANPSANEGESILPQSLAVSSSHVFFTTSVEPNTSEIVSCAIGDGTSGAQTVFAPTYRIAGFTLHEEEIILGMPSAIGVCDAASCTSTLTSFAAGAWKFIDDGTTVYWTNGINQILSRPIDGYPTPTLVATANHQFGRMAVDAHALYFRDDDGLKKVPKNGGTPVLLVPATQFAESFDEDMISDGRNVYVIGGARVVKCSVDGCNGKATRVDEPYPASDDSRYPNRFAMDDTYVYWTTGRTLTGTSGQKWLRSGGAIFRVRR